MILHSLNDLYSRLAEDAAYEIAPAGFSPQKVAFKIVLKEDGTLLEPQSVDAKSQTRVLGDSKPSGAGINPCFLWDNQTYMLGRQPDNKDGKKSDEAIAQFAKERFEAFRTRHLAAEKEINSSAFSAVCRFLENWQPEDIENYPLLAEVGTGFGVFQIQGARGYVHDEPAVLGWWEKNQKSEAVGEVVGQCLVSGEQNVPLARLHPKIKGIAGAQSAGASLVSFNDLAYESYGKTQSYNSPVSTSVAQRYGTALNALLTGPMASRHRMRIGDTSCVFWTEKPTVIEDLFVEMVGAAPASEEAQDPQRLDDLQRLLKAVATGKGYEGYENEKETPFYLLGLAPNAARLSVRFFHRSTVADLLAKLHDHHACIRMVKQFDKPVKKRPADPDFPHFWMFIREVVRMGDDPPPLLGGALVRAIVEGINYPEGLYSAALRRIRVDGTINYLRAALLKAVLVRNHNLEIPVMLDTENTNLAYLLGRLFAALEKTQEDALPGTNATIRDRFYSSASATPASVFPRLLRTYQHHLGKLHPGAAVNREKLVQEIFAPFGSEGFPAQLNLKDQGIFAIGYYQQRKAFFTASPKGGGAVAED